MHRNLEDSDISIGEDLPKRVQEIKNKILIPAIKMARSLDSRNKAVAIGDKLVVNGMKGNIYTSIFQSVGLITSCPAIQMKNQLTMMEKCH